MTVEADGPASASAAGTPFFTWPGEVKDLNVESPDCPYPPRSLDLLEDEYAHLGEHTWQQTRAQVQQLRESTYVSST